MKRFVPALLSFFLFTACPTVENRYLTSLSAADGERVRDIDLSLLDYRFSKDAALLTSIETRVKEMLAGPLPNKEYKARLLGFLGQTLFYKRDNAGVKKIIQQIENESVTEARYYILRALLLDDRFKQIALLTEGIEKCPDNGLIALELAEIYFDMNEFRRAFARYDEAFLALPPRYKVSFQKKRDLAFQLIDQPAVKIETRALIAKSELTVADVTLFTLTETSFLSTVTENRTTRPEVLLERLKDRRYILDKNLSAQSVMKRKDIAFFLVAVLASLENNPGLLTRYSASHPGSFSSPVPDVAVTDYYYNAVLLLVEREIMELPDGRNFFPEKSMSGGAYFDILKKLKSLYR